MRKPRVLLIAGFAVVVPQFLFADQVDDYVRAEMKSRRIPGMAIAVMRDGKVLKQQAYGVANIEFNAPATNNTPFVLASLTKTFTAAAVFSLIDDGRVALDDPISKYVPNLPAKWRTVTIRHCLAHASGLPDAVDPQKGTFRGSLDATLKDLGPLRVDIPGDHSIYNQTGFLLVGMLIERVSGKPFPDYVTSRFFVPLGLKGLLFGDMRDLIPGRAPLYTSAIPSDDRQGVVWKAGQEQPVSSKDRTWFAPGPYYPVYMRTAAGLNGSIDELARWEIALGSGRVVKAQDLQVMSTPYKLNNGQLSTGGLGWLTPVMNGHKTMIGEGTDAVAHLRLTDDRLSVIVLTNLVGADPVSLAVGIAAKWIPGLDRQPGR